MPSRVPFQPQLATVDPRLRRRAGFPGRRNGGALALLGLEGGDFVPADHSSGQRVTLTVDAGFSLVRLHVEWSVANQGDASGRIGLRFNLQIDSLFSDASQLIVEADGTLVGALAAVVGATVNYPSTLAVGASRLLTLDLSIPANHVLDRQGSVTGFNWWIAETTVRDLDADLIIPSAGRGQARDEIRDWFKAEEAAPAFVPLASGAPQPRYAATVFP